MPIVSHTHEATTQANGSTSNVLRLYDQDGVEYLQVFYAPEGFDLAAKVSNAIASLDEQLAEAEFQALVEM